MPIQFRCTGCNQKLAISRRKAGKVVKCPACATDLQVPTLDEAEATGQLIEPPAAEPTPPPPEPAPEELLFDEVPGEVFDDLQDDAFEEDESPGVAAPEVSAQESVSVPTTERVPLESEPVSVAAASGDLVAEPQAGEVRVRRHPWEEEEEDEEEGFHLSRSPIDEGGLDMTPMVDVTFLLLIFFMITASFSIQKSMETEAPEPEEEGAAQMPTMDDLADDSVIVEIDENDMIYVDDAQVATISEVIEELELKIANEQKREMIIEAHPLAKHGTVVQVTDAGIEVGMQRIRRVSRKGE